MGSYFVTQDTSIVETYSSASGCDSVHRFEVIVRSAQRTTSTNSLCAPGRITTPQAEYFITQDTTFSETYDNVDGCDSLHTYNYQIRDQIETSEDRQYCEPTSFATAQGNYRVTQDTLFNEVYPSSAGCDSVHTYRVTVGEEVATSSSVQLCEPSAVSTPMGSYFVTQDTSIVETYSSASGCDSVHAVQVTIAAPITNSSDEVVCGPGRWTSALTSYFITQDTIVREVYTAASGCDSAHTFNLSLVQIEPIDSMITLCEAGSVSTNSQTYFVTRDTIISETFNTVEGCTSARIYTVRINEQPDLESDLRVVRPGCTPGGLGSIAYTPGSSIGQFDWSINGSMVLGSDLAESLEPGEYFVEVRYGSGCRATTTVTLTDALPFEVTSPHTDGDAPIAGFPVLTEVAGGVAPYTYLWRTDTSAIRLSCTDCNDPVLESEAPGFISIVVTDSVGCQALLDIELGSVVTWPLYVPTAFSPNNDGINDKLELLSSGDETFTMSAPLIFDRWGNQLFVGTAGQHVDRTVIWDGIGASHGVYVLVIELERADGTKHVLRQEVSLLR